MNTVVTMDAEGHLTIPPEIRRSLELEGAVQFELRADNGTLILHATHAVPDEDAWAYTPEHQRLVAEALREAREGKTLHLTVGDLQRVIDR
jgi:bifunctional DNA-binding transcriptional regulator/antitoxin component of YhaV-PrlF toxin-antitoxin module